MESCTVTVLAKTVHGTRDENAEKRKRCVEPAKSRANAPTGTVPETSLRKGILDKEDTMPRLEWIVFCPYSILRCL